MTILLVEALAGLDDRVVAAPRSLRLLLPALILFDRRLWDCFEYWLLSMLLSDRVSPWPAFSFRERSLPTASSLD
jgi:hypothetical protein